MFARAATRSLAAAARRPAAPMTQRFASTSTRSGQELRPFRDMPVDVYPLAAVVTLAVCGSFYIIGHTLMSDHTLRLVPDRVKGGNAPAASH